MYPSHGYKHRLLVTARRGNSHFDPYCTASGQRHAWLLFPFYAPALACEFVTSGSLDSVSKIGPRGQGVQNLKMHEKAKILLRKKQPMSASFCDLSGQTWLGDKWRSGQELPELYRMCMTLDRCPSFCATKWITAVRCWRCWVRSEDSEKMRACHRDCSCTFTLTDPKDEIQKIQTTWTV